MQHALQLWEKWGVPWADLEPEPESAEYCGNTLSLGGRPAIFRVAKTTPTKAGQFVTLWQRSRQGPIRPFDTHDGVALFLVEAGSGAGLGQFVFPLSVLTSRGVMSADGKGGKRAMRVYPPDVVVGSDQARRTQKWQGEWFLPANAAPEQAARLISA